MDVANVSLVLLTGAVKSRLAFFMNLSFMSIVLFLPLPTIMNTCPMMAPWSLTIQARSSSAFVTALAITPLGIILWASMVNTPSDLTTMLSSLA